MNETEKERITAELKTLHVYALQVARTTNSLQVTIPDGKMYGFQLEKLLAITRGYSLSLESTGIYLTCHIFW